MRSFAGRRLKEAEKRAHHRERKYFGLGLAMQQALARRSSRSSSTKTPSSWQFYFDKSRGVLQLMGERREAGGHFHPIDYN